jgi:predicted HicB family RNase H-like nuclease
MARHYTYRAEWSPEDEEYVGLVAEFPSLSWLAPTAAEAMVGIERLVDEVVEDMESTGELIPPALADRRYSGKIAVRTSPDLHRRLSIEAAEQNVSLNQWIIQRLSQPVQVPVPAEAQPPRSAFGLVPQGWAPPAGAPFVALPIPEVFQELCNQVVPSPVPPALEQAATEWASGFRLVCNLHPSVAFDWDEFVLFGGRRPRPSCSHDRPDHDDEAHPEPGVRSAAK